MNCFAAGPVRQLKLFLAGSQVAGLELLGWVVVTGPPCPDVVALV
jgi:hypothetical protein